MNESQTLKVADREIDDLYRRHSWLLSLGTNHTFEQRKANDNNIHDLQRFLEKRRQTQPNPGTHPDEIARDYALTRLEEYKCVRRLWWTITKNGVAALANCQRHFKNEQIILRTLGFLSSIPASWAKVWSKDDNLEFSIEFSRLLNCRFIASSNDLQHMLQVYKGDISQIITTTEVEGIHSIAISSNSRTQKPASHECTHVDDARGSSPLETLMREITDMDQGFYQDVIFPLLDCSFNYNVDRNFIAHISRKLTGSGSLYKLSKTSEAWHSATTNISLAQKVTKGKHKWPSLAAPFIASNGLKIEFLTTAIDLIDEESKSKDDNGVEGLNHCVALYSDGCMEGRTHIASVRAIENNSYRRLSTIEIVRNGNEISLRQHYGHGNREPAKEAVLACQEWLSSLATSALPIANPQRKPKARRYRYSEIESLGYLSKEDQIALQHVLVAYAPVFTSRYRGMHLKDLIEEIFKEYEIYYGKRYEPPILRRVFVQARSMLDALHRRYRRQKNSFSMQNR